MQNLLFSPHILLFWELFCQLFYFKRPTLVNSIQSDAPFPKNSKSIMFPLLASIFVKKFSPKFLHFRKIFANIFVFSRNFRENAKMKFSFWPNGNWILTLPHICLLILLKWIVRSNKFHHMYHACRITVKFNGFFIFAKTEKKIREISRKSSHFRMIFAFSQKSKNRFNPIRHAF
jgi:hypothetical protein